MAEHFFPWWSNNKTKSAKRKPYQLVLEALEKRWMPSTVTWNGDGDGMSWSDADNWDTDSVPGSSDDVVISGSGDSVDLGSNTTIQSLSLSAGTLNHSFGTLTVDDLTLSGGTLTSDGTVSVDNDFTWSSGTYQGNALGDLDLNSDATMTMSFSGSTTLSLMTWYIDGTILWTGTGDISLSSTQININSGGTFDIRTDADLSGETGSIFTNDGTIKKTVATGTTTIDIDSFNNNATIDEQSGTLSVTGGTLTLGSSSTTKGVSLAGATVAMSSGTATLEDVDFTSGSLQGGTFEFDGTSTWSGGTIGDTVASLDATVQVAAGGTLSINGATTKTLMGSLTNKGLLLWNAGDINVPDSLTTATITNDTDATWVIGDDGLDLTTDLFFGTNTFTNKGLLVIADDDDYGTNSLEADFTQTSTGTLRIELESPTNTKHDVLDVTETATLAGTLQVAELSGYAFDKDDEFTILTATSISGEFTKYDSSKMNAPVSPSPVYNSTSVVLSMHEYAPEPDNSYRVSVGEYFIDLMTGALITLQELMADDHGGSGCDCACGESSFDTATELKPRLVQNTATASPKPIIAVYVATDGADPVPNNIQARLTWDNGTAQSWQTFATTGHSAGDTYLIGLQVGTAVTASGTYPWEVDIKLNYTSSTEEYTVAGSKTVQVNTVFGHGWGIDGIDPGFLLGLESLDIVGGGVRIRSDGGDAVFFAETGSGYEAPSYVEGTFAKNSDGTYTYTDPQQNEWHFNGDGELTSTENPDGLIIAYTYSGGKLATVTVPGDRKATFTYDSTYWKIQLPDDRTFTMSLSSGALATITGPENFERTFSYNADKKLTQSDHGPKSVSFAYFSDGTIKEVGNNTRTAKTFGQLALEQSPAYSPDEVKATVTDANSQATSYTLDKWGRLLDLETPIGTVANLRDADGNITSVTDAENNETKYTYTNGNLTKTEDAEGNIYTYSYHATYNKVTKIEGPGGTYTYTYDANTGNLLTVTDPSDLTTTYTWSNGLLDTVTQPGDLTTSYTYTTARDLETVTTPDDNVTTYTYNDAGEVLTVTDPNNLTVTTLRDDIGRVTSVTDTTGGTATYAYNAANQLTSQTNRLGVRTDYVYDSLGRQTVVIQFAGTTSEQRTTTVFDASGNVSSVQDHLGNTTEYVYDSGGRQTVVIDPLDNRTTTVLDDNGNVTRQTNQFGKHTDYVYDSLNRATVTIDEYGRRTTTLYDDAGRVSGQLDVNNKLTKYHFDAGGRQTGVTDIHGDLSSTYYDSNGRITGTRDVRNNLTQYVYDSSGRQTVVIDADNQRTTTLLDSTGRVTGMKDTRGNLTQYVYDSNGRQTVVIDALSGRTTTVYNNDGQVSGTYDANGNYTEFVYDSLGRQTVVIDALGGRTTTVFNDDGQVSGTYDANGNYTEYVYDSYGRQTVVIDADSNRTTTVYNSDGQVSGMYDANNEYTEYIYDSHGRQTVTIDAEGGRTTTVYNNDGEVSGMYDANNNYTEYVYDDFGRQTVVIDAESNRSTTVYGDYGQVTMTVDANNGQTDYIYDSQGRQTVVIDQLNHRTTSLYNVHGFLTGTLDATNELTKYQYDALGRQEVVIDAENGRTTTTFDANGNVTQIEDANGNFTTYVYDALNRQTVTIEEGTHRTTMAFDANGNLTSYKDASNNETTFAYDALNRKTSETDPHDNTATFAYNAVGLMVSTTDRLGRRRDFEYDALNRMTTQVWYNSGGTATETMTYSYDDNGNQLTATDSDGTYTMTYDDLNRVEVAKDMWGNTLTFTYDAVGNRTVVEDSDNGVTTYTYDAANNLTDLDFDGTGQNDVSMNITYTDRNELESIIRYDYYTGPGSVVAHTTYTYDGVGRVETIEHEMYGTSTTTSTTTYTYDAGGRLETEEHEGTTVTYTHDDRNQLTADGTNTFTYDATGNRNNGSYTTGTGNQLTDDGVYTYTYDAEGNLTKKSKGDNLETWTYEYDHRNQMTQAQKWDKDPDENVDETLQLQADYKYDVYGNRIEKTVDDDGDTTVDTTERYALDGWKPGGGFVGNENWDVWADLDGNDDLQTRYLRGDMIDQVFARIEDDAGGDLAYWLLTDRQGSVREVVDNSGDVVDSIDYDGYGNISSETASAYRGRYAWTGRELDVETGLQYNRARYYDGATGRWTSQDPLGFDAGDSNLYRYVNNEPLRLSDPSGLQQGQGVLVVRVEGKFSAKNITLNGFNIGILELKGGSHAVQVGKNNGTGGIYWLDDPATVFRYDIRIPTNVEICYYRKVNGKWEKDNRVIRRFDMGYNKIKREIDTIHDDVKNAAYTQYYGEVKKPFFRPITGGWSKVSDLNRWKNNNPRPLQIKPFLIKRIDNVHNRAISMFVTPNGNGSITLYAAPVYKSLGLFRSKRPDEPFE